jgi:hypothetical protein
MSSQIDDIQDDDNKCENCDTIYLNKVYNWCKPCAINNLKNNFTTWTSEDEKIDKFIQEMQMKINTWKDEIIEWIPYDQFNDIKNTVKIENFFIIYSAIWKDGPLKYNFEEKKQEREPNKEVTLKCLNNSQNDINKFLNEVYKFICFFFNF